MKVIGVVGLPASGKGEFSRIAAGLGIPVVVMGGPGLPVKRVGPGELHTFPRAR